MGTKITTIGFDADDTLWHNETFFKLSQERFAALLADFADPLDLDQRLRAAEIRNIRIYGYGIKGFTLSMIETAIEITDSKVPTSVIGDLVAMGRDMLDHPLDLLVGAEDAVKTLGSDFRLVLITKGDLLHQERKLAQSGLGDYFHGVEIVSEKSKSTYADAFARHGTGAQNAAMVGNSMKSDVLPALDAGSWGIYVPHEYSWVHEHAEAPSGAIRFREIEDLTKVVDTIHSLF